MEISLKDINNLKRMLRLFFGEGCLLVEFFPRPIAGRYLLLIYYRGWVGSSVLEDGAIRLINGYFQREIVKETKSYGTAQGDRRFGIYLKKELVVPDYFSRLLSL